MKCECCADDLEIIWTDTHGVAACVRCGLPYTIYHYEGEGNDRRNVDRDPSPAMTPDGVAIAKEYWAEKKMRVFPGCYDMGFSRGGTSYSGATEKDAAAFDAWYKSREDAKSATA